MNKRLIIIIVLIFLAGLPLKSTASLISECSDINYIYTQADIVVYGNIIKAEQKEENKSIYTYTNVHVEKYLKGNGSENLTVKTMGGCIGERCTWVEDTPSFKTGERGYLYLISGNNGFYNVVCGRGISNEYISPFSRVAIWFIYVLFIVAFLPSLFLIPAAIILIIIGALKKDYVSLKKYLKIWGASVLILILLLIVAKITNISISVEYMLFKLLMIFY